MNFQKKREMLYNGCVLNFKLFASLTWFYLLKKGILCNEFLFLHHYNERKLTTICWETSICFNLVVENCLFIVNICLSGASNCLNHFTFFLQNSERCNQSASDSFALFDEISQKTSANQRWETEDLFVCIFDCIWWRKQLFE